MGSHSRVAAVCLSAMVGLTTAANADVITEWDATLRDVVRAVGGGPCPISRSMAMMHVAMYDAVNSVDQRHQAYATFAPTSTASMEAAAAAAGHKVLSTVYPALASSMFDPRLASQLAAIPDGPAKTEGIALGITCANAIIALRTGDGSADMTPYVASMEPGQWRPWPGQPAHGSNWYKVKPWTMPTGDFFRPPPPPALTSAQYAEEFNEVKVMGKLGSPDRTAEQTLIAHFWGNDRDRTYKPPCHLTYITEVICAQEGLSFAENARLFALISLGMADGVIVAWDAKYGTDIDFWRPVDAIRRASEDGNPDTIADPIWTTESDMTPPFPAYISGHAVMGAQHAGVLERFFRTDEMTFTVGTDDPFVPAGTTRTFHRFSDAAWENALSRIYLGVHWRADCFWSNQQGYKVAEWVWAYYLRPACPVDFTDDGLSDFSDYLLFLNLYDAGDLEADLTRDGLVDFGDYLEFLNLFEAGC